MKKLRSFWMDDNDFKKLKEKAKQLYPNQKGSLERYLEDIARNEIFIFKGIMNANIKITPVA